MRFVSILRIGWWIAVLVLVIYAGVTAAAAYFRAVEAVESAVDAATRWQKTQRAAAELPPDQTAAVRDEIVANVRRQGLPLDPAKVRISQSGRTVSVEIRWAQPIFTTFGETVLAVPLAVSRNVEIK